MSCTGIGCLVRHSIPCKNLSYVNGNSLAWLTELFIVVYVYIVSELAFALQDPHPPLIFFSTILILVPSSYDGFDDRRGLITRTHYSAKLPVETSRSTRPRRESCAQPRAHQSRHQGDPSRIRRNNSVAVAIEPRSVDAVALGF